MVFSWNPLPLTLTQVSIVENTLNNPLTKKNHPGHSLISFCGQYSSMWFSFSLWQIQESLSWRKITPCFLSNFLKLPLIWTWIIIDNTLLFVGCLINNVPARFPWSKKYWLINWSGHQWNDYFVIHYCYCLPRGVCCFWDTRQRYSFKAFILSQSQSTSCFLLDIRSFHLTSLQNLIQHSNASTIALQDLVLNHSGLAAHKPHLAYLNLA